ncbi:MAG: hypothetical protein JRJ03_12070 [Deltaproteobacteria bacterium]|nr:hypothetical protein [Deltaproteobacteria bacterium]MBW2065649.1 hypothetical protein [Deltaproteobacteria bacterium]
MPSLVLLSSIGNRILIGFVIGISSWRIHYMVHGALMGLIVTFSMSVGILSQSITGFVRFTVAGIIFGFLIDLFATKVFRAGMGQIATEKVPDENGEN